MFKTLLALALLLTTSSFAQDTADCHRADLLKLQRVNPAANATAGMLAMKSCSHSCGSDLSCQYSCLERQLKITSNCAQCYGQGYTTCIGYCVSQSSRAGALCKECSEQNYASVAEACDADQR